MALSNLQVFDDWTRGAMQDKLAQNIELFNSATNNAIVLRSVSNAGDYTDEAHFARIAGLVRRRDAYGSGAVSAVDVSQLLKTSVKVAAGTPPVNIDPSDYRWIQMSPDAAGIHYGEQLAEEMLQDMLNAAISSNVAAIGSVAGLNYDGTAATASLPSLNQGAGKMMDRQGDIVAWVMHSKSLTDIYGTSLANSERLFNIGNVKVMDDGFGRPLVMTDAPDLTFNDGVQKYRQLGLVQNAIVVEDNGDFDQNTLTTNGTENLARTIQSEWTFNLGQKGFTWDKANGGKSPTDAELATATNWDSSAANLKDQAGVMVTTL